MKYNKHDLKKLGLNIKNVVNSNLCLMCGTCAGVCPQKAITLVLSKSKGFYIPHLDSARCTNCGLCYEICPGHSLDFNSFNQEIFKQIPEDVLLGFFKNCYTGYAVDKEIRFDSASGGAITAILLYALEKGIINGALVTKANVENPLYPQSFIARTREEIISASKSLYCPVPANVSLHEILSNNEKFAVVGLPCHIQGIRKAETKLLSLKNKIILHLGIFCSHCDTFKFTQNLLKHLRIDEQEISRIEYRGKGWPGSFSVLLRNGSEVVMPFSQEMSLHKLWFYSFPRCTLCCDNTAELADISFGDAWLPEIISHDQIGASLLVSRSELGQIVCQEAIKKGYLYCKELDSLQIKTSCSMMQTKKRDISFRFFLKKFFRRTVPNYNTTLQPFTLTSCLRSILISFNISLSSMNYSNRIVGLFSKIELFFEKCLLKKL